MFALLEVAANNEADGAHIAVPVSGLIFHQIDKEPVMKPIAEVRIATGISHHVKLPFDITDDPLKISLWVCPKSVKL